MPRNAPIPYQNCFPPAADRQQRGGNGGGGIPLEPLAPKMLGRDCLCENRIDNTR